MDDIIAESIKFSEGDTMMDKSEARHAWIRANQPHRMAEWEAAVVDYETFPIPYLSEDIFHQLFGDEAVRVVNAMVRVMS